jgi:hypothetical protein
MRDPAIRRSEALVAAATAGRFDVVAQLARELEERRRARAGNVAPLDVVRQKGAVHSHHASRQRLKLAFRSQA